MFGAVHIYNAAAQYWPAARTRTGQTPKSREMKMINGFEEIQKSGKESMDLAMKSFGTVSKGLQAIAVEMADYSKKSFEDGSATLEKLFGAKSLDKALEIQTDYAKSSYEGFVAQSTKMGELFADLAKEAYKPVETMVSKAAK